MSALTPLYLWYQLKHITGRRERGALCICKQGKTRESSTYQGTVHALRCAWALRFTKLSHLLMSNSKLLLCTLCLLCCPEHSHGPAVVSAATLGILACGDLKSLEKAAEIWITGEPQCSHKISARQLFCTACFCRFCPTTPASSPFCLYMSWDCLCISYPVQSSSPQCLPQGLSHLCTLPPAAAALFSLLWWLCTSYSIPPYIPDSGLTLFKVCFYCLFLAWDFVGLAEIRKRE